MSEAPTQVQDDSRPPDIAGAPDPTETPQPGFGSRGRARRRLRFLRKARELGYRDLGGLVYNLHRFGQRNDPLVLAKLSTLGHIDGELRAIEGALAEREPVTVLREAGITACPRCAAIHSSEDRFCPNCGLSMARNVDLPIAGPAATPTEPATATAPAPAQPATSEMQAAGPPTAPMPAATAPPASATPPPPESTEILRPTPPTGEPPPATGQ